MVKYLYSVSFLIILLMWGCGPRNTNHDATIERVQRELPESILKIISAHGGLETWQNKQSMSYEIKKESGNELQEIDLQSRKEVITANSFSTGRDDTGIWLKADTSYTGNAVFYHNLMFYFIAMPFVLADEGIVYEKSPDLEHDGVTYPGLRISYKDSIGISPDDEYLIHYDEDTYEMRWLGYTVTYFSKEKSDKIKWIRYDDWSKVGELLLPQSLDWYNHENGTPTELRNTVVLENMNLSIEKLEEAKFEKPSDATYVRK